MKIRRLVPIVVMGLSLQGAYAGEQQEIGKLVKQGQYAQALERADKFLAGSPKDAQVRFQKGLVLAELGRTADAIKVFAQLSEDFPELPEPYNNLAVLYASSNQLDKAKAALELAIQTHPSYAVAHENLGDVYAKLASQAYDKALQLDKANSSAQTKLSLIRDLFSHTTSPAATTKPAAAAPAPTKPVAPTLAAAPQPAPVALAPAKSAAAPAKPVPLPPAAPVASSSTPAPVAVAKPVVKATVEAAAPKEPPKEAPKEPAEPVKAPVSDGDTEEILQAVRGWAKAWSERKVPVYLGYYGKAFLPPKGESRANWEAMRKDRIMHPKKIEVEIEQAAVKLNNEGHAVVSFTQHYRSDNLKSSTSKTLVLAKSGSRWQIVEERVSR